MSFCLFVSPLPSPQLFSILIRTGYQLTPKLAGNGVRTDLDSSSSEWGFALYGFARHDLQYRRFHWARICRAGRNSWDPIIVYSENHDWLRNTVGYAGTDDDPKVEQAKRLQVLFPIGL